MKKGGAASIVVGIFVVLVVVYVLVNRMLLS